jgi:inorganic pyrophosphatase
MSQKAFTAAAHPWHGISTGTPDLVNCYIEIVPTDSVKYEIDKETGHLKLDRPQKYSSQCPALYGFIPQTHCGKRVGDFCAKASGRDSIEGDGDPLDIMVLTEKPITHGDLLVRAVPIGGLRMLDGNQADDKIIAVLYEDIMYGAWKDIDDCPPKLLKRLRHYFLTYKDLPGEGKSTKVEILANYGADEAKEILQLSVEDYREAFY